MPAGRGDIQCVDATRKEHEVPKSVGKDDGSKARVFETIRDEIRKSLADGSLKVGSKLPSERALATHLGYSRWAVREARRSLEAEGIVELKKKGAAGGAFIRDFSGTAISRSISDFVLFGNIPMSDVTEVRKILLVKATQSACENATDADLDALQADIDRLQIHLTARETRSVPAPETGKFFNLVGKYSKNTLLSVLITTVGDYMIQALQRMNIQFSLEMLDMRRGILAHIRAREPVEAANAVSSYLDYVHHFVLHAASGAADKSTA